MVTPVILTFNEEPNIGTTLDALTWADRIVVLDSGSTDRTEEIARSYRNVSWFRRPFDTHSSQWMAALSETQIGTPHVLALDADMRPGPGFEQELHKYLEEHRNVGARIPFEYRVLGRPLMGSIYPPQTRLFPKETVRVEQAGHTQIFVAPEPLYQFRSHLIHEDRKPFGRWLASQMDYALLESERIKKSRRRSPKDVLRRLGISPFVWGAYAYVKAGGPFNARAARAYAYERTIFEAILARMLVQTESSDPTRSPLC